MQNDQLSCYSVESVRAKLKEEKVECEVKCQKKEEVREKVTGS